MNSSDLSCLRSSTFKGSKATNFVLRQLQEHALRLQLLQYVQTILNLFLVRSLAVSVVCV